MKKGFFPFLIVSLALTAFLAGYVMVKRGADTGSKTGTILDKFDGQVAEEGNQPEPEPESLTIPQLLADRKITALTNSLNSSSVLYFEKNTGKIYEFDFQNKTEEVISNTILKNLVSPVWSPTKTHTANLYTFGANNTVKYFDVSDGSEENLGKDIDSLTFSPDGGLVAYLHFENPASSSRVGKIVISQPNGLYPKKILDTRLTDIELKWPIRNKLAIKTSASEILLLSEDGVLNKLVEKRMDLEDKWSPSGRKLLLSFTSEGEEQIGLWVKDVESAKETRLPLDGFASKCAWSVDEQNIYCAIPKSPAVDDIYHINILTGESELVAEPHMEISEILLSTLENYLLLIGALDEKLYGIKISN